MGQITNELLLEKGLRAEFLKAFNNGENPSDVMAMIMQTKSTSNQEKYGWLGQSPIMREWKSERILSGLADYDYTLPNVDYEATLKVDKNVMEDDQLGAVKIRVRDLAIKAKLHSRKLFFEKLVSGTSDLCYDGQAFFSAAHPESGASQTNLYTSTSSAPYTAAEFSVDFIGARAQMRGYVDDQGEPVNEGDLDLIIVGSPSLEGVVDQVISADILNNATNTLKGAAKKLISSRLSGETWYLVNQAGEVKAFIEQERQAIKFESLEKGERAFMRKELLFGVDKRAGFGYGLWNKAIVIA